MVSDKMKKAVIISLLSVVIVLLLILILISNNSSNSKTIMIYMAGSNLESDAALATSELEKIVPKNVDLEHVNVLVYTGGSKKWFNFVSAEENAIYKLEKDGFKKLETYDRYNMGESDTFETFLNYAYDNYKADSYNLIMWDHGLGALGSISDEHTDDYLDVSEMNQALSNSRFNNHKLDTVIFRTCLNSTYEVASVYSKYAKYMVASEEITYGMTSHATLNFLNSIKGNEDNVSFGKAFITSYQKQMNEIDPKKSAYSTYAIIDLSKIEQLNKDMDSFFSKIDVGNNYNNIARIRSGLLQYAGDQALDYDTVDLYSLVNNLKSYATKEADKLLNTIKETIVYNWASSTESNGIAIYFPYKGSSYAKSVHMSQVYDKLSLNKSYTRFIKDFQEGQTAKTAYKYSFSNEKMKVNDKKEFKLQLTKEEQETFASAHYVIFRKEADNYYTPIYKGIDPKLDKNGVLRTNINNNVIKVVDKGDKTEEFTTIYAIRGKKKEYYALGTLENYKDKFWMVPVKVMIKENKKGKPYIANTIRDDKDKERSGLVYDYKKYDGIIIHNNRYRITDANGKYNNQFVPSKTSYALELKPKNLKLKKSSLDKEGDYYCVFYIHDVQNKTHYSDLIKIK